MKKFSQYQTGYKYINKEETQLKLLKNNGIDSSTNIVIKIK
jgi:hypothetical protein